MSENARAQSHMRQRDPWSGDIDKILEAERERHNQARLHRALILDVVDRGLGVRPLARRLGVNPGTVAHWLKAARKEVSGDRPADDTPPLQS
ncbi:hypothetical protein GCM10025867_08600 [Frondihabitans sucicola]|uniref:Helix-turn-helix domain-containing protein n=1 Tax=Frondihabitans sucicola TaxID=1268041 RepID=A0ABN6XUK3_9MICO|nr:helix-turn-helix domain-containing protein [Frondihabitans sucicola]BDZ48619.1 hypothetical protein GCM10025867_08600 [Frondihabitans sucicola]